MKIISHRGLWLSAAEKNKPIAFRRSFSLGFGTETDLRDDRGTLVISHEPPRGGELLFSDFLDMVAYTVTGSPLTLALNIKADGLAGLIGEHLRSCAQLDYFAFDMSVPDMRSYIGGPIPIFTRMSEVEREPAWLEHAAGIWLDAFNDTWFSTVDIQSLLAQGKRVCVVSPELHGRFSLPLWSALRPFSDTEGLILCTDKPSEALEYFRQ